MNVPKIVENDPWLKPYESTVQYWQKLYEDKLKELTGDKTLFDFATGYLFYGLHSENGNWVIREWAPNATEVFLIGTFNNWEENEKYKFGKEEYGNWSLRLDAGTLSHGDLYALLIHWEGGSGKRVPAWATRAVQDENTHIFNAQAWYPEKPFKWKNKKVNVKIESPLIYEAHIGMAGEEQRVHTYTEFREQILPRIKENGYNTVQLMAIPEHPYYGSFGYHVSGFFAPSSRFGTPDELKHLIDDAHGLGMAVIMDLVHSHAVKNEVEGLGRYDGTRYQFFHEGPKGEHTLWDSYCFNYNKHEVLHFLLSNIKYWLEVFDFDGFRFDGVTSMLYLDHGMGKAFTSYDDYFGPNTDSEAVVYFKLANELIHTVKPHAISIAEDVSGMPGLASPIQHFGLGFDFRMAMGLPDFWIKTIKEKADDEWDMGDLFYQLTSKRMDEKVVSYAESHDQALVGDKTIIFRLIDKEMYFSMRKDQPNMIVDRGIALHKMIRLATLAAAGGAYLNFMGNEFGHPEWIDFPREGNNWSYKHARRIWSIADDPELRFHWLYDFDREIINFAASRKLLSIPSVDKVVDNTPDKILAFHRGPFLFVFNFNPNRSFTDYGIPLGAGKYLLILSTDSGRFGGYDRVDERMSYYTIPETDMQSQHYLKLYLPARTALAFEREEIKKVR